eukprot:3583183-Prymnesium_polylepis.1
MYNLRNTPEDRTDLAHRQSFFALTLGGLGCIDYPRGRARYAFYAASSYVTWLTSSARLPELKAVKLTDLTTTTLADANASLAPVAAFAYSYGLVMSAHAV